MLKHYLHYDEEQIEAIKTGLYQLIPLDFLRDFTEKGNLLFIFHFFQYLVSFLHRFQSAFSHENLLISFRIRANSLWPRSN